jgi:putative component of membrane protein insertase Oxa1/YidC/SpoIIIJ protein YidD
MKTPNGQPIYLTDIYGEKRLVATTHGCKYEEICRKYSPVLKLSQSVGVKGYPESYHTVERCNPCVTGGSCACPSWKFYTAKEMGALEPLPRRSFTKEEREKREQRKLMIVQQRRVKVIAVGPTPENEAVDKQEQTINALKNVGGCGLF